MAHPRIIVLTAPSGAGKTSIARRTMLELPAMRFSISATTRSRRYGEENGIDYFFLSEQDFLNLIQEDKLVEYEEVYPGRYYGTLRSELESATAENPVLLDIDVRGALRVKELFGDDALIVFVAPPSVEELENRLRSRGTEDEQTLAVRMSRSRKEMEYSDRFDAVVVNADLDSATNETCTLITRFLTSADASPSASA